MKLKLIKSKEFTFTDANNVEQKGIIHTCAYKGRVFNISSLDFEPNDLVVANHVLEVKVDSEVVRETYRNELNEQMIGLKIKPKMDLALAEF